MIQKQDFELASSSSQNKPVRTILTIILYFLLGVITCFAVLFLGITALTS